MHLPLIGLESKEAKFPDKQSLTWEAADSGSV
jgi:hypothetical protein